MNYFLNRQKWDSQNKAQQIRFADLFPIYTLLNYFDSLQTV